MSAAKNRFSCAAPGTSERQSGNFLAALGRAAVLASGLLSAGISWGVPIVDQSQTGPDGFGTAGGPAHFAQTFTVGLSGELTGVDLRIFSPPGQSGNAVLEIRSTVLAGSYLAPTPDSTAPLASWSIPLASLPSSVGLQNQFTHFDLSAAQLFATPGEVLAIALHNDRPSNGGLILDGTAATYPGGLYFGGFYNFVWSASPTVDLAFQTYVDPVPEPASLGLLGLGVLVLLRRRQRAFQE